MTRGVNDIGGIPENQVEQTEHDYALWEQRIDALLVLLTGKTQIMPVDELGRGIEALDIDA